MACLKVLNNFFVISMSRLLYRVGDLKCSIYIFVFWFKSCRRFGAMFSDALSLVMELFLLQQTPGVELIASLLEDVQFEVLLEYSYTCMLDGRI